MQEQISQEKKSSKKKNANKGLKTKSRPSNTPAIVNKNTTSKNDDKNDIISVKTNKKITTAAVIPEKIIVKPKENVKTIKDKVLSQGNNEMKKKIK